MKLGLFTLATITTIVLAVLKLVEVGNYSWLVVAMPILIYIGLVVAVLVILGILVGLAAIADKK